jgi:hypothetical protein
MNALDFLVSKDRLAETRLSATAPRPLAAGQMRLRIEKFALTANNITYAAFGKAMSYWDFYPSAEAGWGCIPVWGFATVSESLCPDIVVGERFYGYYPMSSEVILQPIRLRPPLASPKDLTHRSQAARGVQQLFPLQCRSLPCAGNRGCRGDPAAVVHDLLADRRLPRRQ